MICRLNQRVKHIGWKWTGIVVDYPFEYNAYSDIIVKRDDTGIEVAAWIPALTTIEKEVESDGTGSQNT